MVKCERTYPAPSSLAKEKKKGVRGSYREPDVIEQLQHVFHGKCYICEMPELQDGVVEHLLPHHGGKDIDRMFDWDNLFWSCSHCNNLKNRAGYEGGILDCCKEDPEQHINCVYADGEVLVRVRDSEASSRATAKLIEETFNLLTTGIRIHAANRRKAALRKEMTVFFECLRAYRKRKGKWNRRMVTVRLKRETAFAAFKRDYIRMHRSEYPEFAAMVDEK